MKKIILSALVLSMAFAVNAQQIPDRKTEDPEMMQKNRHHGGMEELGALNLTEDQKAKLKTQNETFRNEMEELKKNDGISVKEWKEKAAAIRETRKSQFETVLTSEQKTKLETLKKEAKAKHENMDRSKSHGLDKRAEGMDKRHEGMDKKMGEHLKTELNLTADQSVKMEANHKAMAEQMRKIHENRALTDQQKRDEMMQLHKKQKETLKSILTTEQLQKLQERHKEQQGDRKKPGVNKTI